MFQAQVVVFQPGSSQILIAKSTSHPFDENTVTTRAANGKSHHFRSQSTSRCAAPDLASLYQDAADTTCVLLILSPASSIKYSYLPSKTERPKLPDFQLNIFATFSKYLENPGNIQEAFFPNNLYMHPESKQKMSSQTCPTLSHQSSSCTESMDPECPNSPHRKRAWNISPGPCRCPSGSLESPWESPGGAWPYSACSLSRRRSPRRISAGSNGRGPCPGSRSSGWAEMAPAPRGLLRRTGHRPGLGWGMRSMGISGS